MNDLPSKRLGIETFPNRNIRVFHVNTEVFLTISGWRHGYNSQLDSQRRIGNQNKLLVNELLAIEGVVHVGLERHEISVEVGSVYLWKELQDKIIEKILQRFSWKKEETAIMSMHDFLIYAERHDQATIPADLVPDR